MTRFRRPATTSFSTTLATAAVLMTAAAAAPRPALGQDIGLPLGETPAAATVEDLDGNPVDLATYIGETPVLLEFWATWCPLCEALGPRLEAAHSRFGDRVEFLIVAVGVSQTPRSIRRHLEDHPMPGRVLFDADGEATRAFRAPTTSYVVILDADGRVSYTGAGADQDLGGALARVVNAPAAGGR